MGGEFRFDDYLLDEYEQADAFRRWMDIRRENDGPMGEDSEIDFNAESGAERHQREYREKYI